MCQKIETKAKKGHFIEFYRNKSSRTLIAEIGGGTQGSVSVITDDYWKMHNRTVDQDC